MAMLYQSSVSPLVMQLFQDELIEIKEAIALKVPKLASILGCSKAR
jgi:hypothetical protein